ncbi:MAG TPA: glycosyltransferase [Gaiellaceae bacterium]|nr:glycosyltransferase [Gaiellaceae bacterium]
MRLGVFYDMPYRSDGKSVSADVPVIRFITSLPPRVEELVIFGRLDPVPGTFTYVLPTEGVRLVPLPFYPSIFAIPSLLAALPGSCRRFWRGLDSVDAVWLFGPNPLAIVFALIARLRRKTVFLGVRQDYPEYIAARLPSPRWRWALPIARGMEELFRLLSRRAPTTVEGEQIAANYRGGRAPVLSGGFSLIPRSEMTPLDEALARPWDGEIALVSVGRIDPEKNPLLMLDIVEGLDARFRLAVVGDGPLFAEMQRAVAERKLEDRVSLLGYVPNGEALWRVYRGSNAFLHVSLTEGHPMVFFEAESVGLPIAATDVGGVSAALGSGERGLLVPPRDAPAMVAALERLAADRDLRERLIRAGIEHAEAHTMERRLDAVAEFFRANSSSA